MKGYRTYLVAVGIGVISVLLYLQMIDADMANLLYGLLGASGFATMRSALKN